MKRTRTKLKTENTSSTRNIGTQTADFDNFAEIVKLQEQVKLLKLQNDLLKQHSEIFKQSDTQYKQPYNVEKYSCTCKGNCSSRCGCVKKNNQCSSLCKCNDKICQNQKLEHDENKENVNKNDMEIPKKQSTKSKATEITKSSKSLFSPDTTETCEDYDESKKTYKNLEETQISNIYFNFNDMKVEMENLQTDKTSQITNNVTSKKEKKNKKFTTKIENDITDDITANSCSSKNNENFVVMFDPMKPKHQLSRTPPNNKKSTDKSLEMDDVIEPQSHYESNKDMIVSSVQISDVTEEKVDWQQHTAQLIPCKKCNRTFMPNRVQKHEACCKRI